MPRYNCISSFKFSFFLFFLADVITQTTFICVCLLLFSHKQVFIMLLCFWQVVSQHTESAAVVWAYDCMSCFPHCMIQQVLSIHIQRETVWGHLLLLKPCCDAGPENEARSGGGQCRSQGCEHADRELNSYFMHTWRLYIICNKTNIVFKLLKRSQCTSLQ